MNAREPLQDYKTLIQTRSNLEDKNITVDIIGNAKEAKAIVSCWIEGKLKQIELTARELPGVE